MISSMQKNKKWLLPTIWISTIAFVGAGFVGWGAYDPSTSNGANIATVGKRDIPRKHLQREYNNLYRNYQETFGSEFNQELADKFNIEKMAHDNLIQKFLMLNLSDDIGILATNDDILDVLIKMPGFITDGKFDKVKYKNVLRQNRLNTKDFEEQLQFDITLRKLQNIYSTVVNENTLENISTLFFSQDKVQIHIINSKNINVESSLVLLNEYYEKNKENYKSKEKFKVNVFKVSIGNDEKESKKSALKKYLKFIKNIDKFESSEFLDSDSIYLSKEEQDLIFTSEIGSILKPIKVNNDFVVYQLVEKIKPEVLDFDEIKIIVEKDYKDKTKQEIINKKKDSLLSDFTGIDIGYINKNELTSIAGLNDEEVANLTQQIASSSSIINFAQINDKLIVFKILDTKLVEYNDKNNDSILGTLKEIKNNIIMSSILEKLQNKYEIISNYKVETK